jgi:hypothetical protein
MQTNETHQEPKAHNRKKKAILLIILACVTSVAVAILVTYLSPTPVFAPYITEQITYTSYQWASGDTSITITVQNTGFMNLTIATIQVDGVAVVASSLSITLPYALNKGNSVTFKITPTGGFKANKQYTFMIVTTKGNEFGPYTLTAPSF